MDILAFIILFIIWYGLSLWISIKYGKKMKIGEERSFFLCMIVSPVVGLLITLAVGKKTEQSG